MLVGTHFGRKPGRSVNSGEDSFFLVGFRGLGMVGPQEDKKAKSGVRKPDSKMLKGQTATHHFCIEVLATVEQINTLLWEE